MSPFFWSFANYLNILNKNVNLCNLSSSLVIRLEIYVEALIDISKFISRKAKEQTEYPFVEYAVFMDYISESNIFKNTIS